MKRTESFIKHSPHVAGEIHVRSQLCSMQLLRNTCGSFCLGSIAMERHLVRSTHVRISDFDLLGVLIRVLYNEHSVTHVTQLVSAAVAMKMVEICDGGLR